MKGQDNYKNIIAYQNNLSSLSLQNDNNDKKLLNNNMQLNNFKQISSNINSNLNINNIASLNQLQNLNKIDISLPYEKNLGQNVPNENSVISEFPLIEKINQKKEIINNQNNNVYLNQNNIIYNHIHNHSYFNNNNNTNINISGNNKSTKPYFTSKHVLLNANSLSEVNECINKDLLQLEKFLPYYKNYITNNNSESITICLKYIKYTYFFFSKRVTNKVNEIFYKILYNDNYNNHENNQNNEIYNFKKKIKEIYKKLVPFDLRMNYLNYFYEKNCEKKLYCLFKNDLNKYQRYKDKKYYLYEIFDIVKQKMDNKNIQELNNYFNSLFNNSKNQKNNNYNNLFLKGNNNMNNEKIGGNYSNNYNNFHNNIGHQYRKYSYQSPNSQNRENNSNYNNNDNSGYKNSGNHYHCMNYNNKNNHYNNLNMENEGYKSNYDNNHNHSSTHQRNNNFKGCFSSKHYYINNNNNKNANLRNKGNRKNSSYSGILVEVDSTPKKSDIENDTNDLGKKEFEQNIININEKDEKINNMNINMENENIKDINKANDNIDNINNEENYNIDSNINNEEIDLENNLNINDENSKKENIYVNEDEQPLCKNEDENENLLNDFNSINPFNDNLSSEENDSKEKSNNKLISIKSPKENNIINMNNKLEINNIENNSSINKIEENTNFLIQNIIYENQNNMINTGLKEFNINIIRNIPSENTNKKDINIKEENKNIGESINEHNIINENNINIINETENKNNSLSYSNIINDNHNLSKINSVNSNAINDKDIINNKNNLINNNNNFNHNIINNNLNKEQLQILIFLISNYNTNDLLMNINPLFNNQFIQMPNHNANSNYSQLYNNIYNIIINTYNANNLHNINLFSNLNSNINHFNNYHYPNIYQNYNTIFFNYWNEENNLLSKLRNKNNIKYINKKSDKLSFEYEIIKIFEKENPEKIKEFTNLFEEKIILPIYTKINEENQIKKEFYTEIYNKYKNIILKILSKHKLEDTQIEPFGSIVNNFMTEWGDIDICIVPKDNNLIQNFWEYLEEIKEEVINTQKIAKFTLIERYPRYLLLKLKDIETNIDLDITVQNLLPILNTKLIRQYSLLDQRFHIIGIFLKFWVKKNKIHGALDKFLSSYALLILIIHYLQNITEQKILPILQQIDNVQKEYIYIYEDIELKTNLYFEEDIDKINNYMNIINNQKENNNLVVELLIGFFEFYAYEYNHYLISISRSDKKPINKKENIAFPLEDPFDVNYNPGKSMQLKTLQYSLFIYCMKKELNNILSGEYFKYSTGE